VHQVVARGGEDRVGIRAAGSADIGAGGDAQVLDIGRQRVVDNRQHRIDAGHCGFDDHVGAVIDVVGVCSAQATQRIGANTAIERIGGVVALQAVGGGAARQVLDAEQRVD